MIDNDVQPSDEDCPKCGNSLVWRSCTEMGCEDGEIDISDEEPWCYSGEHASRICDECNGSGSLTWCQKCGWT